MAVDKNLVQRQGHRLAVDGYCIIPQAVAGFELGLEFKRLMNAGSFKRLDVGLKLILDWQGWGIAGQVADPDIRLILLLLEMRDVRLRSLSCVVQPPRTSEQPWHRGSGTNRRLVDVIHPWGDMTPELGCLRVVPGSHLRRVSTSRAVNLQLRSTHIAILHPRLVRSAGSNSTLRTSGYARASIVVGASQLPSVRQSMMARDFPAPTPEWWSRAPRRISSQLWEWLFPEVLHRPNRRPVQV